MTVPGNTVRSFWQYIAGSIERIIAALSDLEDADMPLDWRPPASDANSVYTLAVHALGTTEHRLLAVLCGLDVERNREAELSSEVHSTTAIVDDWCALPAQIVTALDQLTEADLAATRRQTVRGEITGLDVLIVVTRHAAEHAGQADLTRDLALAAARA